MSQSPKTPAKKPRNIIFRLLGPGLVTGAADDDPSGIATYSQAGAQFGYGLLWTVFLTTPFMIAIQLVSAQIGRVTGKGLAANVSQFAPRWLVIFLVSLLVVENTFNIAADIQTAAQAAEALRPLAGELTFLLFALGIIGTGLLAIPVLAGSAAYGVAEAFGWPATLEAKAPDAVGFYGIIAAATIIGFGLGFTSIDPIKMLIWSAVLNGIVAVPIMVVMMIIISKINLMGRFKAKAWLLGFGWGGTVLMAIAVIALVWSSLSCACFELVLQVTAQGDHDR
jgi:Mn2+/Fe2+ NRAMP family transporter